MLQHSLSRRDDLKSCVSCKNNAHKCTHEFFDSCNVCIRRKLQNQCVYLYYEKRHASRVRKFQEFEIYFLTLSTEHEQWECKHDWTLSIHSNDLYRSRVFSAHKSSRRQYNKKAQTLEHERRTNIFANWTTSEIKNVNRDVVDARLIIKRKTKSSFLLDSKNWDRKNRDQKIIVDDEVSNVLTSFIFSFRVETWFKN